MFHLRHRQVRRSASCLAAALVLLTVNTSVKATNVYWDTNGASMGATNGTTASGTWDNTTTTNWTTTSNGNSATTTYNTADSGSPLTADVFFSAGGNATGASTVTLSGTGLTTHSITFEEGAVTLTGASLTLAFGGSINVSSGNTNNQTIQSNLLLGQDGTSTGSFTFTNNSTTAGQLLTISGDVSQTTQNSNNPARTINLNGAGNGLISGVINGNGTPSGNPAQPLVTVAKSGAGTWTLSGANTYAGGTNVTAGTLLVTNTTGSGTGTGAVTVTGSGTTFGGGTTNGTGGVSGSVTVGSGANLSPSSSTGNTGILKTGALTLQSGSNYLVDINGATLGTQYDQVSVIGTVNISGSVLKVTLGNGFTPNPATQAFVLISNDGTDAVTGVFGGTSVIPAGYRVDYQYNDSTSSLTGGNDVALIAVPEPSTWIAATLALGAIGCSQRKRLRGMLKKTTGLQDSGQHDHGIVLTM
jgi:fibronectin-binding autotransporter adhesin